MINHGKFGVHLLSVTLLLCCVVGEVSIAFADESSANIIADQQQLTVAEQKALKGAIEDYEFQEQSKAIAILELLRKKHPTNLKVLHYIGLSYEESKRYTEAQGAYAQWIKYSGDSIDQDARFAWIGMAKAYDKTKHTAMGMKLIRKWLSKHPNDYDATVALGDMMVREKDYDGTKAMFKGMLAKKSVPANYQASAHYYLGFIAWLEGDVNEVQAQGGQVLRVEPEGGFASVIKQLMATPPPRKLGLNVTAGLEGFYVDNVESKPTYRIATKGNSRTTGVNTTLGLTWNFRHHLAANYNFGGTFYSKRPDLDLGLHMAGITWANNGVQIGPRYEFVTMYNKTLYKGIGVDFGWSVGQWMLIESVRYKAFGRTLKVLDGNGNVIIAPLNALSGWNNSLMVLRQATWGKALWMIGGNFVFERTKGSGDQQRKIPRLNTEDHNRQRDSFNQIGFSASVIYPDESLLYSADMNGYIKKYRGIDYSISNPIIAKRKDEYVHVGAGVTWTPEGQSHHALSLKAEWNNNNSNFDFPNLPNGTKDPNAAAAAAYSQWKQTAGYAYTW